MDNQFVFDLLYPRRLGKIFKKTNSSVYVRWLDGYCEQRYDKAHQKFLTYIDINVELTVAQKQWLIELYDRQEITTYRKVINKPLKKLIDLNLVKFVEEPIGLPQKYYPMYSFSLTNSGKILCWHRDLEFKKSIDI